MTRKKGGLTTMTGKWQVFSNVIGNTRMYIAGRILDTNKPVHSGNVENSGGYTSDRSEAEAHVAKLNESAE